MNFEVHPNFVSQDLTLKRRASLTSFGNNRNADTKNKRGWVGSGFNTKWSEFYISWYILKVT